MTTIAPVAVSVPEFAEALSISKAYAYVLVERGEVRTFRLGRRVLVPVSELERLVAQATASEGSLPPEADHRPPLPLQEGGRPSAVGPQDTAVPRADPDAEFSERAATG